MNGGRGVGAYGSAIRVLSAVFIVLGLIILVRTVTSGGGPLSLGVFMGLAMVGIGIARLWLAERLGG
ncbi:MAG TPA: hypothetical protein VFC52_07390 [Solirubrobacterales bacterium]|nr:hypothetical protein [Solirubrobacterales bacterium]HZK16394.1 hypothetical protein [Solirubrobacterales bacterium]